MRYKDTFSIDSDSLWAIALISVGLGLIALSTLACYRHYEVELAAIKAGLVEVQNVGGSGSHWDKPKTP